MNNVEKTYIKITKNERRLDLMTKDISFEILANSIQNINLKAGKMVKSDNHPVEILLCSDKGSKMVEYALSGMDN